MNLIHTSFCLSEIKLEKQNHCFDCESIAEHDLSIRTCETLVQKRKSSEIDVEDSGRSGRLQKCEDKILQESSEDNSP